MDIHETAKKGFQKSSHYDAHRPSYTDEIVSKVLQIIRDNQIDSKYDASIQYDILELGAGTGKFTRQLVEKLKDEKLLSSDPSVPFLETLKQQCPEVECLQFAANNIPLENNSVKAVVCAQCFHWFANIKSLNEISRVLVPGGLLFLVYNRHDQDNPMVFDITNKLHTYMGDNPPPQYFDMKWKDVFKGTEIQPIDEINLEGTRLKGSLEAILNYIFTISYMTNLSEDMKAKAREEITTIIKRHAGDKIELEIPHKSVIHLYQKKIK